MNMGLVDQLAAKSEQLIKAKQEAMLLEQELTCIGHELVRQDLGERPAQYLRSRTARLLNGQPRGEVAERHLFSALEDAWRAGAFAARGGVPGPAPVTQAETDEINRRDGHGAG